MKRDGVLEVRIVCANRPGLLVDVMEAVESRGLTVVDAKIACHSNIVFEYLSLEVRHANLTRNHSFIRLHSVLRRGSGHQNCAESQHRRNPNAVHLWNFLKNSIVSVQ